MIYSFCFIFFHLIISFLFVSGAEAAVSASNGTVWDRMMEEQASQNIFYGYKLLMAGRHSEAASEFLMSIQKNPKNPYAHIGYGSALYWLGKIDNAKDEFNAALALDPKNASAYQLRGIVKAKAGLYDQSLEDHLLALKYAPERPDIRMNIGSIYAKNGDMARALDNYRRAVNLEKNNPLFRFQLAKCYVYLGRYDEAEKELRKAIMLYPYYEDAIFELAALYEQLDDLEEAARLFKRAIKIKPRDSVARFRLARILYDLGRKKEIPAIARPGFLIAPANDKGGISMGLSYSASDRNLRSEEANNSSNAVGHTDYEGKNSIADVQQAETVSRIEENLLRVPESHNIKMQFEILELPRMKMLASSNAERSSEHSKKGKMAAAMSKHGMKYEKKEYILEPSSQEMRIERIKEIVRETESMLRKADKNSDIKVNFSMETSASDSNGSQAEKNRNAHYVPRDVGNDMGLWIYGESWLEGVAETLNYLEERHNSDPMFRLIRGLGYLIMGETSSAIDDFSLSGADFALGRSAAYTAAGDSKSAIQACDEALKARPGDKIALKNLEWLKPPSKDSNNKNSKEKISKIY